MPIAFIFVSADPGMALGLRLMVATAGSKARGRAP
jgi:hypothetical protein